MADEEEIKMAASGADDAPGGELVGEKEAKEGDGEELPEGEEEEEDPPTPEPTEEELLQEELRQLGIPTEEALLEEYPFPAVRDPTNDDTGRAAYCAKAKEFDFFMFPINSVTSLFDLRELNLRHSGLGDKGAIALAETLKVNKTITELSLVDNWITPHGGAALLEAIQVNTLITSLDVSENRLGYRAGQVSSEGQLGTLLHNLLQNGSPCRQLKTLTLRKNHIGDRDLDKLCDALASNTWLHEIDLSYNELGPASGKALGQMLAANMDLRSVKLEWNQLRGPGCFSVINDGLMDNNTIRTVNLAWNGAEEKAGDAFGQCLSKNGSLEEVDLSHNRIGERGATKIAEGLAQNQSLKRLILSFNPLTDNGCAAILTSIREANNSQLCFVDIKNADPGPKAQQELQLTKKAKPNVEIAVPRAAMLPADLMQEQQEQQDGQAA
eukprot:TRINITY_DN3017_c0_g1_i1.p1 TRINITY_DN3017_c0_g1~~TRINITY_DN3017_c0_g1_i1.p1  ORF type:complete len:440 (+),score=205.66 TRINITY_DN3017_c0_g1_i1:131-1450(+)